MEQNNLYPYISIIIPTRNAEKDIGICLQSLQLIDYPKDKFEIIICDGLSQDNTREIAAQLGAKVIINKGLRVSPARNIGFSHAIGEFIAFTDADCTFDKEWLKNALKYFEDSKIAGVGGPTVTPIDMSPFEKAVAFVFEIAYLMVGTAHSERKTPVTEVNDLPGCNSIYRQSALKLVMPIDENLVTNEDVEMNFRLREHGFKLLRVPDVIVYHHRRTSIRSLWKQIYRYAIGRVQVARKSKKMIRIGHIIVGCFFSFWFILWIVLLIMSPVSIFLINGVIFFIFFGVTVISFIKYKSIKTALNTPVALIIILFAWSFGFMKEILFPLKNIANGSK